MPHNGQAVAIDWTVPAFAVLLPLFGLVWWAFQRREGALRDLAQGALRVFWGGQPGSDNQTPTEVETDALLADPSRWNSR